MKQVHHFFKAVFSIIALTILVSSCQKMTPITPNPKATEKKTITELVSQAPNLRFLEAAVIKAGLAQTLDKPGTFTVFAPTDDAFKAAGFKTVADVTNTDAAILKDILLYHVLGSEVTSTAVQGVSAAPVKTLLGKDFYVTGKDGNVWVNDAMVIAKDVKAKNGIIHVIDKVLIPPTKDIVELAQSNPDLSILVAAVVKAGAVDLLKSAGPFTVFAPTNKAFEDLLVKLGASGLGDIPNSTLLNVLKYHVLPGRVFSYNLVPGTVATALPGSLLTVALAGGATVKGSSNTTPSNIVAVNILATNGVVHVIDQVLLP